MYNLSEVFVSKSFFRSCFFFFFFVGLHVVRFFFRYSMFVRVLGVRMLLQVLWSDVSRFKCQWISLGLIFQFEVWVSNDSKI